MKNYFIDKRFKPKLLQTCLLNCNADVTKNAPLHIGGAEAPKKNIKLDFTPG